MHSDFASEVKIDAEPSGKQMCLAILKRLHVIDSDIARDAFFQSLLNVPKPTVVSFLNAHALNMSWSESAFARDLYESEFVLRDGIGISVMMKVLGLKPGTNMNGSDLIPMLASLFTGKRVALCGSIEPYLSKAAAVVVRLGCEVVLTMDGFKPDEDYVAALSAAKPDLIVLGMGMPKQERVAATLAKLLQSPVVIVNGGAIIDFWSSRFPRAPMVWRKLRLEWLFRLLKEPTRLWKRYTIGGVVFLYHTLQLRHANIRQRT